MGNHMACMSPGVHASPLIKVLHFDDGQISEFQEPLKAAEIMLEYPNQFLCHSTVFHNGQRISPVAADDELKMGQLYMLFPMRKLNGRLTLEELDFFGSLVAKSVSVKPCKSGRRKVTPMPSLMPGAVKAFLQPKCYEIEERRLPLIRSLSLVSDDYLRQVPTSSCTQQMMICRSKSWIPKLETITEASMSVAY